MNKNNVFTNMPTTSQKILLAGTALAGSLLVTPASAALVLDYATGGTQIHFKGGAVGATDARYFDFTTADNQFEVTASSGGGSAVGLKGTFGTTQFKIGAIGAGNTAPVLTTGTLTIHDGVKDLVATVDWTDIGTFGKSGSINVNGVVNLSSLQYGGNNSDLLAFMNSSDQNVILQFGFSDYQPVPLLQHLMAANQDHLTSFSGQMSGATPVPEASTWVAGSWALGLLLVFSSGVHSRVRQVFRIGAKNNEGA